MTGKQVLNREKQLQIMKRLHDVYPKWLHSQALEIDGVIPVADMWYLMQHGLIEIKHVIYKEGSEDIQISRATATQKGMDFLLDDGGLSAIFGVLTVRIHDDTLKSLIEAKILQADLAPEDKKKWIDQLRSLPADATKHLVLKLVDKGLEGGPAAIAWLGTFFSQLPPG